MNERGHSGTRRAKLSAAKRHRRLPKFEVLENRQLLANFPVTSMADDGSTGTLRWAVDLANAAGSASSIEIELGNSSTTIILSSGALDLTNTAYSTTIYDGPGQGPVTISGNAASEVFQVNQDVTATISGLTITEGLTNGPGGGIYNQGNLALTDCTITANTSGFQGGGIFNAQGASLAIQGGTISQNSASVSGGGIEEEGTLSVDGTTFVDNDAGGWGGAFDGSNNGEYELDDCQFTSNSGGAFAAIANSNGAQGTISASSFSGNTGSDGGAISVLAGSLTIINSSISGSIAYSGGAALVNPGATLTMQGCTISGNSAQQASVLLNNGTATVDDSTISGNSTTTGAAIVDDDGSLALGSDVSISGGASVSHSGSIGVTGPSNSIAGGISVASGTLNVSGTGASLVVSGPVTLSSANISVSSGGMLGMPGLTTMAATGSISISAQGKNSAIQLPNLSAITGDTTHFNSLTQVQALSGGDIEIPLLKHVSGGPVYLESTGASSKLDMPGLTSIQGTSGQAYQTTLEALNGGSLVVSDLSTIGGADVLVEASGEGTLLSFPALATISADTTQYNSLTQVQAFSGGDVELPLLNQVMGGPVIFDSSGAGSTLNIGTLPSIQGASGQAYQTTLEAQNGGSLTASALSSIGGTDFLVNSSGSESLVSLPVLATISADTTQYNSVTQVQAFSGGDVELPLLSQVLGGPVIFDSSGAASKLDIGTLTSINGASGQGGLIKRRSRH